MTAVDGGHQVAIGGHFKHFPEVHYQCTWGRRHLDPLFLAVGLHLQASNLVLQQQGDEAVVRVQANALVARLRDNVARNVVHQLAHP